MLTVLLVLARVAFAFSVLGVVGAGYLVLRTSQWIDGAARADAVVLELVPSSSRDSNGFAPVFEFDDADGERVRVYSRSFSYPPVAQVGDTIAVLYDPEEPEDARTDTFFAKWGVPLIAGIFASLWFGGCLVGVLLLGWLRRKVARDEQAASA